MQYTNDALVGLGKLERERLAAILRQTKATISVRETAEILGVSRQQAGKYLATLAKKGWLKRIYSGVYIPIPLESNTPDITPEDPLIIAEKLFAPCYIAGWSAAEYWNLTEQIFHSVVVMTQKQQKNYAPLIADTKYLLHLAPPKLFFGLKTIWRSNVKVQISDPTRTIVDLINNPLLAGGIRFAVDILKTYFASKEKSVDLLIEYLQKQNNGAAYKRMGFLTEKYFPNEMKLIKECRSNLTKGNAKLDSSLTCDKLVTKWKLWVPENWK